MVSDERGRERGTALVAALGMLVLLAAALAAVGSVMLERQQGYRLEERQVRLEALADAAMAEALASLAADESYTGSSEREVGGGTVASDAAELGGNRWAVTATGRWGGWRLVVEAEVRRDHTGLRVVDWTRRQSKE